MLRAPFPAGGAQEPAAADLRQVRAAVRRVIELVTIGDGVPGHPLTQVAASFIAGHRLWLEDPQPFSAGWRRRMSRLWQGFARHQPAAAQDIAQQPDIQLDAPFGSPPATFQVFGLAEAVVHAADNRKRRKALAAESSPPAETSLPSREEASPIKPAQHSRGPERNAPKGLDRTRHAAAPVPALKPRPVSDGASGLSAPVHHQVVRPTRLVDAPLPPAPARSASSPAKAASVPAPVQPPVRKQAADPAEPAQKRLQPMQLPPDGEARRAAVQKLRQMPTRELKAVGIVTAVALDGKVAEIKAGGQTRRRIEAKRGLEEGLKLVKAILAERGERLPDHKPPRATDIVSTKRGVER